jgi:surface protein
MCSNSGTVFSTGSSLRVAVNDYLSDKDAGMELYGRMNCWDVSAITDMSFLFYWKSTMNEDIACWDVSNVTNMDHMFYAASSFNHDLAKWNVSKVSNMAYMFYGASLFNQSLCLWYPKISWNILSSNSMLLYSGCDFISSPSVSLSATFCQLCHSFPPGPQVKRLLVFHQICQVMLLSAPQDVQETVCVATLVSVYVSLGGVVVLVQYQLVLAIVFAMAMVIVQPMKLAHALKGLVVHHAVLSTVPIEIYATEMVFAALQMFALVMMDMKELTAPIAGAIFVIFLVSVLCAPFV